MFTHTCIKPGCGQSYQDEEQDAYYCPPCNSVRLATAKEMDAKFNTTGQQPSGMLKAYDEARQGRKFPRASALGL